MPPDNTNRVRLDKRWYRFLNPVITGSSRVMSSLQRGRLSEMNPTGDPSSHIGHHRVANPRYKEWWYFDAHFDDGQVLSLAIVFSVVRTHYFLWVYDSQRDTIKLEIEHDGSVEATSCWALGHAQHELSLEGEFIQVRGDLERGFSLAFCGATIEGDIKFSDPIVPRAELHNGVDDTIYGLYQSPRMVVSGRLRHRQSGDDTKVSGLGYHDHWWGIAHRVTRWRWLQAKFQNGWTAGFYEGGYGWNAEDIHRYAWLFGPEEGYSVFDNPSLTFSMAEPDHVWHVSAESSVGRIELAVQRRVQRYQYKPVMLAGIRLGEVQYFQYPVTCRGSFVGPRNETTNLVSDHGMLEWDWLALW